MKKSNAPPQSSFQPLDSFSNREKQSNLGYHLSCLSQPEANSYGSSASTPKKLRTLTRLENLITTPSSKIRRSMTTPTKANWVTTSFNRTKSLSQHRQQKLQPQELQELQQQQQQRQFSPSLMEMVMTGSHDRAQAQAQAQAQAKAQHYEQYQQQELQHQQDQQERYESQQLEFQFQQKDQEIQRLLQQLQKWEQPQPQPQQQPQQPQQPQQQAGDNVQAKILQSLQQLNENVRSLSVQLQQQQSQHQSEMSQLQQNESSTASRIESGFLKLGEAILTRATAERKAKEVEVEVEARVDADAEASENECSSYVPETEFVEETQFSEEGEKIEVSEASRDLLLSQTSDGGNGWKPTRQRTITQNEQSLENSNSSGNHSSSNHSSSNHSSSNYGSRGRTQQKPNAAKARKAKPNAKAKITLVKLKSENANTASKRQFDPRNRCKAKSSRRCGGAEEFDFDF